MKTLCITLLAAILILAPIPFTFSARANHTVITLPRSDWQLFAPAHEEFSVLMPPLSDVYLGIRYIDFGINKTQTAKVRIYRSLTERALFVIQSYEAPNLKDLVEDVVKNKGSLSFGQDIKLNGFKGKSFSHKALSTFSKGQYLSTKKHLYIIEAITRNDDDPSLNQFLDSFNLGVSNSDANLNVQPISQPDIILSGKDLTRKAAILWRPLPTYNPEARQRGAKGTISLKALLSSTGKVADVQLLSGLGYGLNEQAIEAAKQIIFMPAEKDGRYISQWVTVEYNFNMY